MAVIVKPLKQYGQLLAQHNLQHRPHHLLFSTHALSSAAAVTIKSTGDSLVDEFDRRLLNRLQQGLPLVRDPWGELATELNAAPNAFGNVCKNYWMTAPNPFWPDV